ncbi:ABC transporter permease [Niabella aurantiaca]|uniref:ABC transporter permease n=1 Tax=Niabella aurantiaca TaxID=379900 RepID=UPI00037ACE45|nr:ABC transporter permease [Niabella aurantiaca]
MLKNYIKTLIRTFRKNKVATVINFIGLTVAFTCAILLLLRVYQEFSYDQSYPHGERIFKVYNYKNRIEGEKQSASIAFPAQEALKMERLGIEKAALVRNGGGGIRYGDKQLNSSIRLVGADFLSIFSLPMLEGTGANALSNENNVVITEPVAASLFGTEDPVGKQVAVNVGNKWLPLMVSGVIDKLPYNSSLDLQVLARIDLDPDFPVGKNSWDMASSNLYVRLMPGVNQKDVEQRLRQFSKKYTAPASDGEAKRMGFKKDAWGDYGGLRLLPVTELHFNTTVGSDDAIDKTFLYLLLLIAGVILLIAGFNFVNLNMGVAFTRFREMGIRKYMGAQKRQIWIQVWCESAFLITLSAFMGTGLALALVKKFNQLFGASITASLLGQPVVITGLVALILFISLMASGSPALLMNRLKVNEILKGKLIIKGKSGLRNVLIVFQFIIAVVLICATVVIYQQFQHLRTAPLGYEKENLISVPMSGEHTASADPVERIRNLLNSQTSVISVSASNINLGLGKDGSSNKEMFGFDHRERHIRTAYMAAGFDILKTLGVRTLGGRDFTRNYNADSAHHVIVTESFVKKLDLKDPVGQHILYDSAAKPWHIVGVIPDFHLYSLYHETEPLTIGLEPGANFSYLLVKVKTTDPAAAMDLVKNAWREVNPGAAFLGSYVDENVDRWYRSEQKLARMFSIAAGIAIILSCMGLFAMAFIVTGQRTKEIGVRKVLGASVANIASLVGREFVKPVVIAIFIAMPIALWALNKWLQHFTYRVSIAWWVFAAAGGIALVIAVATVSIQAIKAAAANPVNSLRNE